MSKECKQSTEAAAREIRRKTRRRFAPRRKDPDRNRGPTMRTRSSSPGIPSAKPPVTKSRTFARRTESARRRWPRSTSQPNSEKSLTGHGEEDDT